MCEKKRRHSDRDEKHVRTGFMAFLKFYEFTYRRKKSKTFDEFIDSQFYIAFVCFGRYVRDINAISPSAFVEFLLKNGVPIDKWCNPTVYETYLRELNKRETPDAAFERNLLLMQQWSLETENDWTDFFRKVAPAMATRWITTGRISPWVLFVASSANELMARMSDEQMSIVQGVLDTAFWGEKLETYKDEVARIQAILDEAGL